MRIHHPGSCSMQAASVNLQSVLRWLSGTKGIDIHEEWLRACVEWILSEESVDSEEHLRELVYEQWLHADLRDTVPHGCIPECVARQQKGHIRGRFIVQVQSVVDVSKPAYGQLQKLKGKSLDEGEPAEKRYSAEPKANRLLLLKVTDGVTDLQAMEYQPIKQLNMQQLLPGAKLMIEGEIHCRLGVVLLNEGQVQVLGGQVEQLVEANAPRKVLARLLNDESLAGGDETGGGMPSEPERDITTVPAVASGSSATSSHSLPHNSSTTLTTGPTRTHGIHDTTLRSGASRPSTTTGTRQQHGDVHRSSAISASSTSSRQREGIAHRLSSTGDNLYRNSSKIGDEGYNYSTEVGGGVSELVDGEVDLDNFEDFDDNLYNEMEMEGEGGEGEVADIPGHHEWPLDSDSQNDFQLQEQDAVRENFSAVMTNTCSSEITGRAGNLERFTSSHSHSRVESDAPKSKLSLRQQKSSKTRVCELEHGVRGEKRENQQKRNPPIASVKPIQQQRPQQPLPWNEEKQRDVAVASSSSMLTESELYEEPVVLKNIREVESNSWKLQPFVKIKAHFVRVCEMLDHTSGEWKVSVMVGDDQGCRMRVHLSDKILETWIGFSAQEFKDHINPRKNIPKVKARAAKGFALCGSAIEDLNCFMVITQKTDLAYPCVIQLLDH